MCLMIKKLFTYQTSLLYNYQATLEASGSFKKYCELFNALACSSTVDSCPIFVKQ